MSSLQVGLKSKLKHLARQETSELLTSTDMAEILKNNFEVKTVLDGKVPVHSFELDGQEYEWYEGNYYKRVALLYEGKSFGELALKIEKGVGTRAATIKSESEITYFATLSKKEYLSSLKRIDARLVMDQVDFLNNIPCFKTQSKKAMVFFTKFLW